MLHLPSSQESHRLFWRSRFKALLDFWLESPCPLCQRSTPAELCRTCRQQMQQCQLSEPDQWRTDRGLAVFAWGAYQGILRRSLAALKYDRQSQLASPLGQALGQAWLRSSVHLTQPLRSKPVVVPIPLHPTRQQQRGYNQALLLAEGFCQVTKLPLERQGLLRIRATEAQFSLSAAARSQNLTNAFQVGPGLLNAATARQGVLLLDDIYTTGATVHSALQVLQRHKIPVVGVVVLARSMAMDRRVLRTEDLQTGRAGD